MKTRKIAKILGLGLAAALAFSLGAGLVTPASAGVQEWDTVTTPSWEDNVIVPGADIYDFAVGPDGETIYAVGAIKGGDDGEYFAQYPIGVTGGFYISYGLLAVENVSGDMANISADFEGWSCVLIGAFSSF